MGAEARKPLSLFPLPRVETDFLLCSQGRFLQNVTWEFLKRWTEEKRSDCCTPLEWRLTPEIRHEFVKTMRTVALLSMFSRDPITIANAQAALKTMGMLEPDLIFPPLLERAYPALETLTEVRLFPLFFLTLL